MKTTESSSLEGRRGKLGSRLVLRGPVALLGRAIQSIRTCPSGWLACLLCSVLWLTSAGLFWEQNTRLRGQLQQSFDDLRVAIGPRLLALLYEPTGTPERGATTPSAHVRVRSAAVVAFVKLSRSRGARAHSHVSAAAPDLVNLQEIDLPRAQLVEADLGGVDFSGANLQLSDLRRAKLSASTFSHANLADVQFRDVQAKRVRMEQANLRGADFQAAHLQGARFFQSMLEGATIKFGRCAGASFRESKLAGANLEEADLRRVDLVAADLRKTSFRYSKLVAANLADADLRGANFELADLTGANLRGANLQAVDFRQAGGLTLKQVRLGKNWRLALFRDPNWVTANGP